MNLNYDFLRSIAQQTRDRADLTRLESEELRITIKVTLDAIRSSRERIRRADRILLLLQTHPDLLAPSSASKRKMPQMQLDASQSDLTHYGPSGRRSHGTASQLHPDRS